MSDDKVVNVEEQKITSGPTEESDKCASAQPAMQLKSSMLRPSVFGFNLKPADTLKTNILNDSKLNPFLKEINESEKSEGCSKQEAETVKKNDPFSFLKKNGLPKSDLLTAARSSIPLVQGSSFVFGQNIHERVTGENLHSTSFQADKSKLVEDSKSSLLFSSVVQNKSDDNVSLTLKKTDNKSLTEVARAYEESRAKKRKYEEVETFTGEEDEINVIDLNCKLFAFLNRNWEERGRGSLRLNDTKDNKNSRVVFRTSGNLRLLLNTKVWAGMVAERPNQKSLRLTAMDNTGQIKLFLVMSRPEDINNLHKALIQRIEAQKNNDQQEKRNGSGEQKFTDSQESSPKKAVVDSA